MLTERIHELPLSDSDDDQSLDFFESSLTTIFNDVRNQHGEPGRIVSYASPTYGSIKLGLADIDKNDTSLFSHHLWNAGVEVAEMIEDGRMGGVQGKDVVEVGAGAALPSLVAAAAGARTVLATDYPSPEILSNITKNISYNPKIVSASPITVEGHIWGVFPDTLAKYKHSFDIVIAADTLWMDQQHENLVESILFFLKDDVMARAVVVAGLHTGRQRMAGFWDVAVREGLVIASIVERDVDGKEREWLKDRGQEDATERKRWLTIGFLQRAHAK